MLTNLLLAVSGVLIGAGLVLLARDWLGAKRLAFLPWAWPTTDARQETWGPQEAEVGVTRRPRPADDTVPLSPAKTAPASIPHPAKELPVLSAGAARFLDEAESAEAWASSEQTLAIATRAINGAFSQAGTQLAPRGLPQWSFEAGGHRLTFAVEHAGRETALVEVLRDRAQFAVRVLAPQPAHARLGPRVVALDGLTVPRLAEVIAACAWACVVEARRR